MDGEGSARLLQDVASLSQDELKARYLQSVQDCLDTVAAVARELRLGTLERRVLRLRNFCHRPNLKQQLRMKP